MSSLSCLCRFFFRCYLWLSLLPGKLNLSLSTLDLNEMCLTKDLVYQAEVTTKDNNERKTYIGMTATTFKERYRNHKKSFDDIKYKNDTELSKYVWNLKLNKKLYKINWSILSRASSIKAGGSNCNLCLEEKLQIISNYNSSSSLNKRSELFTKCAHARKFYAGRFKRTCVSKLNASNITYEHNRISMLPDDCFLHETLFNK